MKAVVLLKLVPDSESRIQIAPDQASLAMGDVKFVFNPYDEHAIEEAILLKTRNPGSEVIVMSLGDERSRDILLKGMGMGADRAVLISNAGMETGDSLAVARVLAAAIKAEAADVVFCGKQAIDDDNMHVGLMVAELLGWPHINNVRKFDQKGPQATVEREFEAGQVGIFEATFPMVVGCHKSLNKPRYPSFMGLQQANRKPFARKTPTELGVTAPSKTRVTGYTAPPARSAGKVFSGESVDVMVGKVVQLLRDEAKVI